MRYEEYKHQERDIMAQMMVLRNELTDLRNQYAKDIVDNVKEDFGVEIGDKVIVTYLLPVYPGRIERKKECYFGGSRVNCFGFPETVFYKINKTGSQSQQELRFPCEIVKMEKI